MRIVVIGNGVAGEAACSAIRLKNQEAKLTLLSEDLNPFYSPCILTHYISKELKRSQVFLKNMEDYQKKEINVLLGRKVERIDHLQKQVFFSDQKLDYDKLILATGSRPVVPRIEGVERRGVWFLKSLDDADLIYQAQGVKAVIVGSGPIGIELAVALIKRRWEVCLIEALDWILPYHFDENAASILRFILEEMGIEILTGERVLAVEGKEKIDGVVTTRGGKKTDMIVLTTGMRPNVELACAAGINIGGLGGIRVNDRMETNLRDIYACGDCVEGRDPFNNHRQLSLLWPQAERQGRVAGLNSIDESRTICWLPDFINIDIFGTFAGAMGRTQRAAGPGAKLVEKEIDGCYRCVVFSEGKVAGAQFIGNHEAIGVLLPFIGEHIENIKYRLCQLSQFPWYFFTKDILT